MSFMSFFFCCVSSEETKPLLEFEMSKPDKEAKEQFAKGLMHAKEGKIDTALECIKKAADRGMAEAQTELGIYYLNKEIENRVEGRKWITLAANQDERVALECLKILNNLDDDKPFPMIRRNDDGFFFDYNYPRNL